MSNFLKWLIRGKPQAPQSVATPSTRRLGSTTVSEVVSNAIINAIIYIESAGNPRAKARTSSATGLAQFISSTWLAMLRKYRPGIFSSRPTSALLDLRLDPALSIEMLAKFTEENYRGLQKLAHQDPTPGDLYLAHFLGLATASRLMKVQRDIQAESIVGARAVAANRSILKGKTCGEIRAWADTKMRLAANKADDYVTKYLG